MKPFSILLVGVALIGCSSDPVEDISSYFRTDRNFCYDLFSNNEAIIPEGLEPQEIEIEIGSAYPAKNSLYRFEAKLEGLTVVGYSKIFAEAYYPITIIFDDPIEEVLERLSPVYSPIFPTSPSRNASVDYMDDEFYLNIEAFDQEATLVRNSFGRSSLSCFVRD